MMGDLNSGGASGRASRPTAQAPAGLGDTATILSADLLYLVRLADWCAGQGFCELPGLKDPDEWCYDKWDELFPAHIDIEYSAEQLAEALAAQGTSAGTAETGTGSGLQPADAKRERGDAYAEAALVSDQVTHARDQLAELLAGATDSPEELAKCLRGDAWYGVANLVEGIPAILAILTKGKTHD